MSIKCRDIEPVLGCLIDGGGVPIAAVAVHFEYRVAGNGNSVLHAVRYTDAVGTPITLASGQSVTLGACPVIVNPNAVVEVTGGAAGGAMIAGGVLSGHQNFSGATDTWSTSTFGGDLQSITVTARGVVDAWRDGSVKDQIIVDCPDGTKFVMMNGQTFTWSVGKSTDARLLREYTVRANGNAYANIGVTFI